jgi:hypothetical protein
MGSISVPHTVAQGFAGYNSGSYRWSAGCLNPQQRDSHKMAQILTSTIRQPASLFDYPMVFAFEPKIVWQS